MKDEPEDLTHLAPTAGDACVPLGSLMVTNLIPDSYCPLIDADKETPLFSSYRDDCSTGSLSPSLPQVFLCSLICIYLTLFPSPTELLLKYLRQSSNDINFRCHLKVILIIFIKIIIL